MGFKERGYISVDELRDLGLAPPEDRLRKGPVVIVECPEMIPCDICVYACPRNAISMDKIYGLPRVDWDKCTGCGVCVGYCPGLAIFVVDVSKPDKGYVTLPYEFLPEPRVGLEATLLDRGGRVVGKGRIVRVWSYRKTWVVTVEVPHDKALDIRAIRIE